MGVNKPHTQKSGFSKKPDFSTPECFRFNFAYLLINHNRFNYGVKPVCNARSSLSACIDFDLQRGYCKTLLKKLKLTNRVGCATTTGSRGTGREKRRGKPCCTATCIAARSSTVLGSLIFTFSFSRNKYIHLVRWTNACYSIFQSS